MATESRANTRNPRVTTSALGDAGVLNVRLAQRPLVLTVLIAFGLWILLRLVEQTLWVWILVLLGLILAAAMKPLVDWVQRPALPPGGWHVPPGVAVMGVYLLIAALVVVGGYIVVGLVVDELVALARQIPAISAPAPRVIQEIARSLSLPPSMIPSEGVLGAQLRSIGTSAVGLAASFLPDFVTFVVRFFIVLTLAAFVVVEWDSAIRFWIGLFPPDRRDKVYEVTTSSAKAMGNWVLGALTESTIVGVLGGLAAAILGLPFPVIIGIATGLVELMPMVGPMLMIIPAFLLGLLQSPVVAIVASAAFFGIAQLDASVFAPTIARWSVKISPLIAIVAIPLGVALYGAIGALIAIPVAAALQIFVVQVLLPWLHRYEGEASAESGQATAGPRDHAA